MANRYAVATGNWSDTAIWNGGTLPTAGDVVRPNGFTVTIDQDITVDELTNNAAAPAVAGGSFASTMNVVINANIKERTTITLYNINGGSSVTINGDCISNPALGSNSRAVAINAALTLNVNGTVTGGGLNSTSQSVTNNQGIFINAADVFVVVNGTVNGGGQTNSTVLLNNGIYSNSQSTHITITGVVNGSPTNISPANTKAGIAVTSANSTIIINGTVTGKGSTAIYTTNATTFVTMDGIMNSDGIRYSIEASNLILKDVAIDNTVRNQFAGTANLLIHSTGNVTSTQGTETIGDTKLLYTAGLLTGYPLEAKVEDGTLFGPSSEFEGTLVPVTVDVQQLANDLAPLIQVDTQQLATDFLDEVAVSPDPLAERLRNVATVQSTGAQIASIP